MKPIEVHPEADEEFQEALDYYERKQEGLGSAYRSAIREAINRLRARPESYPIYEDTNCQQVQVWRFPFVVYYLNDDDRTWIVAIANQYRRPGYWRGRLRGEN